MKRLPEVAKLAKVPSGLIEPSLQTAQMDIGQSSLAITGGNWGFTGCDRLANTANWETPRGDLGIVFRSSAAQWALPIDEGIVPDFIGRFRITFEISVILVNNAIAPSSRHAFLEEDARKLREIISRLNILKVDHTEHACLKALVLFKAG